MVQNVPSAGKRTRLSVLYYKHSFFFDNTVYCMKSLVEVFRVYDCDIPRIRMGENRDGGYIFHTGFEYDLLLSGGINDSLQFEDGFVEMYKVPCIAHDHTILQLPKHKNTELIHFDRRMISNRNSTLSTNLSEYLRLNQRVFVKMDIESSEWDWLESLEDPEMRGIDQMVVELHLTMGVNNEKHDVFFNRMATLERLNRSHMLTHVHNNNWAQGCFLLNDVEIPIVIECTYLHKKYLADRLVVFNMRVFPTELDWSNNPTSEDNADKLNQEPFRTNRLTIVEIRN